MKKKELVWKDILIGFNGRIIQSNRRKDGRYFVIERIESRRYKVEECGFASGLRNRVGFTSSIKSAKTVCNLLIK